MELPPSYIPPYQAGLRPFPVAVDLELRRRNVVDRHDLDPLEPFNQVMLLHDEFFTGRPAYDFESPNQAAGRTVLFNVPTLVTDYGEFSATPASVAANIAALGNIFAK